MSDPLKPDPNYEVQHEEAEVMLKEIGHLISGALPKGHGFMLQIFSFGPGGHTFYISNAQRDDMISNMKELIEKLEKGKT